MNKYLPNPANSSEQIKTEIRTSRHIRFFDRTSCEFMGQKELKPINEKYLRRIFNLEQDNPMLFSYAITAKQQKFIERLTGLELNLQKYQYFMECDF